MHKKIKISLFAIILIFNSFAFVPSAKATWPDIIGFTYGAALDEIKEQIMAALLGALKQAAIDTINETVNNLISGTTQAGSLFITDWEDYLFNSPRNEAGAYMNDFFTVTSRGKSSGNFQSACGGESFTEWRTSKAKQYINTEVDYTALQSDFEEYACDTIKMFDQGTWDAYIAFMQPNNNPIAYQLIAESVYEKKVREKEEEAKAEAISYQGFKAKKSENGIVLTPGSTLEEITASANTISDQAIATATNPGEMVGLVVGKIASQVIKQGIGNARQNVQNEINDEICNTSQDFRDALGNLMPNGNLPGGIGIGSLGNTAGNSECVLY